MVFAIIAMANVFGTTYYSTGNLAANLLTSWNSARDGSGSAPANFTTSTDVFIIQGTGNGGTTPHSMTTSALWTLAAGVKLEIENGAILTATNLIASLGTFQVDNGGTYNHNATGSSTNGASTDFPGSTGTGRIFGATSNVNINVWAVTAGTSPAALPTIAAPGWGNLTINYPTVGGSVQMAGALTAVQGNLTVSSTGGTTREFRLQAATGVTTTIGGNLTVSGGILGLSSGTTTAAINLNVGGNLSISGTGQILQNSGNNTTNINVTGSVSISGGTVPAIATAGITTSGTTLTAGNGLSVSAGTLSLGTSSAHVMNINVTGDISISGTGAISGTSSSNSTVSCTGNFSVSGTGLYQMQNSSTSGKTHVLNVGGNFNLASGATFTGGSNSSTGKVNFTGGAASVTFTTLGTVTAGKNTDWTIAAGKSVTLANSFAYPTSSVVTTFLVTGTLDCSAFNISGVNNFTLGAAGTLKSGSPDGISSTPATGSIQVTGGRTFPTTANYEYNGSASQVTGNQLPATVNKLTINNSNGVSLTATVTASTLELTSGKLTLGANNVTANTVTGGSSANYVITDAAGALKINAVGASNILFPVGPSATGYNPITINNAGTVDNFSVKVKPTFTNAPFDATQVVNMEWQVAKDGSPSGNNVSLTPQWNASDEAGSFNRAGSLVIGHFSGTWDETASTLGGAGPYTATASGFTSFSPFGVGNAGAFFNATPANVVLASPSPAVVAGNVGQGINKNIIYQFNLAVTANAAILNSAGFTTGGTYTATDVTSFQLWYNTTNNFATAAQIGTDITTGLGSGAHTFSTLTQGIANAATGYFWITADIAASGVSTPGNTINVAAITTGDISFASANKSGTASASDDQTIVAPSLALSSANPAVAAGTVGQGVLKSVIYNFTVASSNAVAILNQINFTTGGTYTATDLTKFQVWYNTTNNFGTAVQLGADITTSLGAGSHSLSSLTQAIGSGITGNFWITADIAAGATINNTVNVAAITTADLSFASGSKSGTAFLGGDQVIIMPSLASDDFRSKSSGDWALVSNWESSPAGLGTWHNATLAPTSSATTVTIQSPHVITVSTAVTAPNTTINSGGEVVLNTGAAVAIGAAKTLTIDGTLTNNITGTPITFGAGALINVGATGIYNLAGNGGQIPTATWNPTSTINVTGVTTAANLGITANSTYGNFNYNCPAQTAASMVPFSTAAGINFGGNFTISSTGTGLLQIISSGATNFITVGGNFEQHGGIVLFNPSNTATTVRPMVVLGNFTIDNAVSTPTFRISNGTATANIIVKGNVTMTNANIENTVAAGNSNIYFAGTAQNYSRTAGTTTVSAGSINYIVNSGSTVDFGTSIVSGTSFSNSGPYTYSSITGTTTNASNSITGVSSTAGLQAGMQISGTGIPAGTYITSVGVAAATTITISKNATASGSVTLTLSNLGTSTIKLGDAAGITSSGATGNIQVSGTRTFVTTGNYEYDGTSAQVTGNGLPASVNNLAVNNSSNVSLTSAVTANTLALTSGKLILGASNITANTVTGGSAANYVVTDGAGTLNINGIAASTSTTFPVGSSTSSYNPVTLATNAGHTTDNFSVRVANGVLNAGITGTAFTTDWVDRGWFISEGTPGGSDVNLTVQWTAAQELSGFDRNNCTISHWDGTAWDDLAGAAATGADPYSISRNNVSSFSPFGVQKHQTPTPLTLLSFSGILNNGLAKLNWTSTNEINVKHFVVEKSTNGSNFSSIGTVNAANTAGTNLYNFTDPTAISGVAYYRLRMVDLDGKFRYSIVIALNSKKAGNLAAFPNPVNDQLFVTHAKATAGAAISIYAMDGRKVAAETVAKDAVQQTINTSRLSAGIYQLVFQNGDSLEHIRFVKQ